MERRDFLKTSGAAALAVMATGKLGAYASPEIKEVKDDLPKVFFTKDISPAGMMAAYAALARTLPGKVAVKVSTGEPGGHNFLSPTLIKDLVQSVSGTIVECNTAYGGRRSSSAQHKQVAADHGFTAIAAVDIMDEDGSVSLPFAAGKNITEDFVGSHFKDYQSFLVLSHFKGHAMAGFGGAMKNISIGIGSVEGKCWIHSGGHSRTSPWGGAQDPFLESMAEAGGAVMGSLGDNILFINVMNHLSIDCDCSSNPAPSQLDDIGILSSHDPVALDKACVDLIYAADPAKRASLVRRMEQQNGIHCLNHAASLGLGSLTYEIVDLDKDTAIEHVSGRNDLFVVYPNPVTDRINVSGDFESITLLNINGSRILQTSENVISFSGMPAGIYLLQINGKESVVKKVIKR